MKPFPLPVLLQEDSYGQYDPRYRHYDSGAAYMEPGSYRYPEPERPSSRASHCSDRPASRCVIPQLSQDLCTPKQGVWWCLLKFYSINHREEFKTFVCCPRDGWYQMPCLGRIQFLSLSLACFSFHSVLWGFFQAGTHCDSLTADVSCEKTLLVMGLLINTHLFSALHLIKRPLGLLMNGSFAHWVGFALQHHGYTVVQVLRREW